MAGGAQLFHCTSVPGRTSLSVTLQPLQTHSKLLYLKSKFAPLLLYLAQKVQTVKSCNFLNGIFFLLQRNTTWGHVRVKWHYLTCKECWNHRAQTLLHSTSKKKYFEDNWGSVGIVDCPLTRNFDRIRPCVWHCVQYVHWDNYSIWKRWLRADIYFLVVKVDS